MRKRIVSSILSAVMLLLLFGGTLAGCKKKRSYNPGNFIADPQSEQIVKNKVDLYLFTYRSSIHGNWNDMYLFKELERRTNIRIVWENATVQDMQMKRANRWENTSTPLDGFFLGNSAAEISQNIAAGNLRALNGKDEYTGGDKSLLELYAPEYCKWMEVYPQMEQATKFPDGNLYSFSSVSTNGGDIALQYINKKWIDNLHLADFGDLYVGASGLPETTDQFYNTLKAFKDYDANGNGSMTDEVPIIFQTDNASLPFIKSAFGFVGTNLEFDEREKILDGSGSLINNPDYKKLVFIPASERYREYADYIGKLYRNKIMHDGFFSNNEEKTFELGGKGVLGSFCAAASYYVVGPARDNEYVALPPLTSKYNPVQMAWEYRPQFDGEILMIPKRTPYYREMIRWIDQFYKLENEMLQQWGGENVHWKYDEGAEAIADPVTGAKYRPFSLLTPQGEDEIAFLATGTYTAGLGHRVLTAFQSQLCSDPLKIKAREQTELYQQFSRQPHPPLVMTLQDIDETTIMSDPIGTSVSAWFTNFVIGEEDITSETVWQKYLGNIERYNYKKLLEKYVEIFNKAYPDDPARN